MSETKGSCLCGAIKYTFDSDPLFTAVCHCAACQKSTGTAFSVVVGVRKTDLKIAGGGPTPDRPELVADKILEAAQQEPAEQFIG